MELCLHFPLIMKTALLIILQIAATGSDSYFTRRNAERPFSREYNPIARPFVHSNAGEVFFGATTVGTRLSIAHLLRKHGHGRLGDAEIMEGIAESTEGTIYTATH
jgi:hypothetical protein